MDRSYRDDAGALECSLVIPVFNNCFYTRLCLESLRRHRPTDPPYEIIVVDNASTDDTARLLAEFAGDVSRVIRNAENRGFAVASNQGASAARGRLLVFLNNDVVVGPGWLAALVATADADPAIGAVGARLLYPDGTIQHAGLLFAPGGHPNHAFCGRSGDWAPAAQSREYQAVTGACLLVDRKLFDGLGGFDEGYVNSFEDVDLCFKIRQAGRRVWYCAEAVAHHFESATPRRNFRDDRNRARFLERWQDAIAFDLSPDNAPVSVGAGGIATLRGESEALGEKVRALAAENAHLRRLLRDPLPLTLQATGLASSDEATDHADLVYRPARLPPLPVGASIVTPVVISNVGAAVRGGGPLHLSYHWLVPGGAERAVWDGIRTTIDPFPAPGQSTLVWAAVTAPSAPGRFVLEWDAVEEGVTWLSDRGVVSFRQTVDVVEVPAGSVVVDGLPTLIRAGAAVEIGVRLPSDRPAGIEGLLGWRWNPAHPDAPVDGVERLPIYSEASDPRDDAGALRVSVTGPRRAGRYHLQVVCRGPGDTWIPLPTLGGEVEVSPPEEAASQTSTSASAPPATSEPWPDAGRPNGADQPWSGEDAAYFRARFRARLERERDRATALQARLDQADRLGRDLQAAAESLRCQLDRANQFSRDLQAAAESLQSRLDQEREARADLGRLVDAYRKGRVMRLLTRLQALRRGRFFDPAPDVGQAGVPSRPR